jgi:hypothetical protein
MGVESESESFNTVESSLTSKESSPSTSSKPHGYPKLPTRPDLKFYKKTKFGNRFRTFQKRLRTRTFQNDNGSGPTKTDNWLAAAKKTRGPDLPKSKTSLAFQNLGNLVITEVLPTKSLDGHSRLGPKKIVNAVQKSKNHCGANDLSVTVIRLTST